MKAEILAFVTALKQHLKDEKPNYVHRTEWNGDTEHGFYSQLEFSESDLMKEIDDFAKFHWPESAASSDEPATN